MVATLVTIAGILLLLCLLSPRVAEPLYRKMIFSPVKPDAANYDQITEIAGVRKEDFFFQSGKNKLHGWFFRQGRSPTIIIFSHSNWGNIYEWRRAIEQLLKATDASVFAYDYRGYGKSEGTPSIRGVCEDGVAAFDFVANLGYWDIVLYGSSIGSAISCHVSQRRPCDSLILHGAFTSLRALSIRLLKAVKFIPPFMFFKPEMDNLAALKSFEGFTLLLHGEDDTMVPLEQARELEEVRPNRTKLVVLPKSEHMDTFSQHPLFAGSIAEFIR